MSSKSILLVVLVLIIIGIVAYFLFNSPFIAKLINQAPPVRNDVLVSGIVTTGFSTSPSGINFTSEKTGQVSYATIDKDGHYSITVLGNDTYNVTIYYSSLVGTSTSKNCRTALSFNSTVTSFNFSRSC
jgi:hypothetical protein